MRVDILKISDPCYFAARFMISFFIVANCYAQQSEISGGKKRNDGYIVLGLLGYNYTDRHISDYSVNGGGGGNISMSSPTSGGSGVSCCVRFSKSYTGPIQVKVRWQVDGCVYLIKDDRTGKADKVRHYYYKETEVDVQRVPGEIPKYIETHFYADGTVRVRLAEHGSAPLLALNEKRPDKSHFPKCKDDKKPEE
jgi:hypothetical protein